MSERANIKIDRERMATQHGPSRYADGSLPIVWVTLPWPEVRVDSVSWSSVEMSKDGGWIVSRYCQWGDYGGSTCERSNYEVFCESFESDRYRADGRPNWVEIHGGHGSCGIAVAVSWYLSEEGREVRDFLDGLHEYPLADEEHHSELEMRLQQESWDEWACSDLLRELATHTGNTGWLERPELAEAFESDELAEIWPHVLANHLGHCGSGGVFSKEYDRRPPHCEDAVSAHWPVDDYAGACSEDDLDTLVGDARAMLATWHAKGAYACIGCRKASAAGDHGTQERLFNVDRYEVHYPGCSGMACDQHDDCKSCPELARACAGVAA